MSQSRMSEVYPTTWLMATGTAMGCPHYRHRDNLGTRSEYWLACLIPARRPKAPSVALYPSTCANRANRPVTQSLSHSIAHPSARR